MKLTQSSQRKVVTVLVIALAGVFLPERLVDALRVFMGVAL